MLGWIIAIVIAAALGIAGRIGWSHLEKEHHEARNLPLKAIDFSTLAEGTYQGAYEGGMYKWRANQCQVTVSDGKVSEIQLTGSMDPGKERAGAQMLYDRVIQAQSLQVDTISGATLTSKAYLKGIENALIQAQNG